MKTLLYAVVLIFVPFLFIKGGFSNIKQLWNNFRGFSGSSSTDVGGIADTISSLGPTQWTTNATLETLVYWLTQGISAICGGGSLSWLQSILSKVTRFGLLLCAVILPCISAKSTKQKEFVTLAVGTYLLFPGVGNGYCLVLMLVPFFFMIRDWDNMTHKDKIFYTVCYIFVANPLFYSFGVFLFSSLATTCIVVKSIVDIIKDDIKIWKEKKDGKKEISAENVSESEQNVNASTNSDQI